VEGADLNCLVFSAETSATFKFNVGSLLLLLSPLLLFSLLLLFMFGSFCFCLRARAYPECNSRGWQPILFYMYFYLTRIQFIIDYGITCSSKGCKFLQNVFIYICTSSLKH